MDVFKSLYLEHGWKMPDGFRDKARGNPLNYTGAEWQQAMRIGRKAIDIKRELQERWQKEEVQRSSRIRKGFKDIWDKLNGRYWKTRKRNEQETWKAYLRDQKERENLIQAQLGERQSLQITMNELRVRHDLERQEIMRDMSHLKSYERESFHSKEHSKSRDKDHKTDYGFDGFNLDDDLDHEL